MVRKTSDSRLRTNLCAGIWPKHWLSLSRMKNVTSCSSFPTPLLFFAWFHRFSILVLVSILRPSSYKSLKQKATGKISENRIQLQIPSLLAKTMFWSGFQILVSTNLRYLCWHLYKWLFTSKVLWSSIDGTLDVAKDLTWYRMPLLTSSLPPKNKFVWWHYRLLKFRLFKHQTTIYKQNYRYTFTL
jgi:hypothetical protein